ncbi:TetR/AcrR family transcriptional regulator [Amycolatopsis sp. MtRt-6]|uniref:TetR/AcrR family transcriptional regulator n=1 Tax=Amycolatopsis sp. MtRt-6 TaxID=2792782 RepID=UPI001A8F5727|nr:TetR/AcrR family transcriptional regulator [Amycolatopsis sp. MtRt-6]
MTGRTRLTAEQRRETILTAATAVFAERGYQRAKASEIAARVGVSEPVVFQNFGSKAGLFAAVIERASDTAEQLLSSFDGGPVPSVLRALLSPEHLDALHAPGSLGVLFAEGTASDADPRVREAAAAAVQRLARGVTSMLQRAQEAGELSVDLDAEAFAWSLMSFVAARSFRRAVAPDAELERRLVEQLLRPLG